jgi:hypothetical protein
MEEPPNSFSGSIYDFRSVRAGSQGNQREIYRPFTD